MYENHSEPLLSRRAFAARLAWHFGISSLLILGSLAAGAVGYHLTQGMGWLDATLCAAMILTGMGPVGALTEASAKLFAIVYSLYSGVAFLAFAGLLVAPVAHRLLHKLHVDEG
jgi:hypothetical protein